MRPVVFRRLHGCWRRKAKALCSSLSGGGLVVFSAGLNSLPAAGCSYSFVGEVFLGGWQVPSLECSIFGEWYEHGLYTVWEFGSEVMGLYGDPLEAYKQPDGTWTDTDKDGLPDIVELDPVNVSTCDEFWWCWDYFVKQHKDDAEALSGQFNPLVQENTPPDIYKVYVETYKVSSWIWDDTYWAKVEIKVRDIGRITNVEIGIEGSDWAYNVGRIGGNDWDGEYRALLSMTKGQYYGKMIVVISAVDSAGNCMYVKKEIRGTFAGLVDILEKVQGAMQKAWERVKEAVDWIVEWVIETFESIVNKFIELIQFVISGITTCYGEFLKAVSAAIVEGDDESIESLSSVLMDNIQSFAETIIEVQLIMFGTIMAVLGLLTVVKVMTGGVEAVVETMAFTLAKDLVIAALIGLLIKGLWDGISSLVEDEETDTNTFWDWISDYIGITVTYTSTIVGIVETFVEYAKKKAISWFVLGLTLAISGYFLNAATTSMNLSGAALIAADLFGMGLSFVGLIIMIYERSSPFQRSVEITSPLIGILEWVIAIGGLAKAVIDTSADYSSDWSG